MAQDLRKLMMATAVVRPMAVETKEWGTVHVRAITVDELEEQSEDTKDWKNKRRIARGAARVICDSGGGRVFDPDNEEDVALIGRQPWPLLKQVIDAADEFNGTTKKAAEAAKND